MWGLASHVYAAEVDGALVFLDLKRDHYTYLPPGEAREVLPLLGRRLFPDRPPPVLAELSAAGLVTDGPSGRPFRPIAHDRVVEELPRLLGPDRPRIRAAHVATFVAAVAAAKAALALLPLHRVVGLVERRHRAAPRAPRRSMAELTEIYRRLRPLLFSRGDRCLLDSLGLVLFLRRYGIRASWRFGVRLAPFRAHAWAQAGDVVLDDMAALIHGYTVILEA